MPRLRLPAPPDAPPRWPAPRLTSAPVETAPGVFAPAGAPLGWSYRREEEARTTASAPSAALVTAGGLERYVPSADTPWTLDRANHLLQRTALGGPQARVDAVFALGAGAADTLLDRAAALPETPEPAWFDRAYPPWDTPAFDAYVAEQTAWLDETEWGVYRRLMGGDAGDPVDQAAVAFRERLALVWSNHFVTEHESYFFAPQLARYWRLLRHHALGDLRTFVHEVGLNPAMLVYLDGRQNRRWAPNENYARELLELFAVGIADADGQPTYTQTDVEELARALTGWDVDFQGTMEAVFFPEWHDDGDKTILGQRGPWGYDDVVPLLFDQRGAQIARHISAMLYRAFVYEVPNQAVVTQMADLLVASDYQIEPVVRALLTSAHFYDDAVIRARIKGPVEQAVGLWTAVGAPLDPEALGWLRYRSWLAGQVLFEPWTVAGWPEGRAWVDTSTLPVRWYADATTLWIVVEVLAPFAQSVSDPFSARAFVAEAARLLLGRPASAAEVDAYVRVLLDAIPEYEWNPYADGAPVRVHGLLEHLARLPEFLLS
ncbi:DUF1800 domain-containing protein [Rubrivirga sp. IMCC45206]|uniref:DUF1800 domain-containing protein n=1 Tax=Rubrivirga sp. IMCC45206 TaxID=3391614 RepID=UPI00398FFF53